MKQSVLFILFLFFVQATFGQDWQPIYLGETLNYMSSANPDEPIGVFASDLSINNDSSDVRLVLDADSLDECSCEPTCFRLRAGFMQNRITYSPSGVIAFQNPDTFYFHTQANTGDSWVFDNDTAGNEIMATITSATVIEVLGQPDSLKIISLSTDEEIHLSKLHGIIKWISSTDTLSLLSIPKRGLGETFLNKVEVYNFNVGDVFCYVTDDNYYDMNDGVNYTMIELRKIMRFEILSITESDSSLGLEIAVNGIFDAFGEYTYGHPNYEQFYFQDTILSEIELLTSETIYEIPDKWYSYKGADVIPEEEQYWAYESSAAIFLAYPEEVPITSVFRLNKEMFNGRRMLSYGMSGFTFQFTDQTTITDILAADLESYTDFVAYCSPWGANNLIPGDVLISPTYFQSGEYRNGLKLVAEGLGVVAYHGEWSYGLEVYMEYKATMIGYQKEEETYGYVPEVIDLMSVGVTDRSAQVNFSVYPNPASNSINILMPTSDFGQLRLFDISGRVLYTMPINSEISIVETAQFPSGVYFIQVETQNGIGVQKVIISR